MAERKGYVYGSAAHAYTAEPARRRKPEQEPARRGKRKPKTRVDKVSVLITLVSLTVAFLVCFSYLQKQFETTYLSKSLVSLENEVVELEKQNAALSEEMDLAMDLSKIYELATKELGMVHAKDNQVYTYISQKGNQVKQHGNIPGN